MITFDIADPTLRAILTLAQRAPSVHNTQPWAWCASGNELHLFADLPRGLGRADPQGRDLVISCGAVLHHLRVSSAGHGWRALVRRAPDPFDESHLASVTFEQHTPTPEDLDAAQWIRERRTDRRRATSWPVPPARLDGLGQLAADQGARLVPLTSEFRQDRLAAVMREAAEVQESDPAYLAELNRWSGSRGPEGVPEASLLDEESLRGVPEHRFPSGTLEDVAGDDDDPGYAWALLCTSSDDHLSWLRAGEALSTVWLTAASAGLAVVPYSQAVEVTWTRKRLQAELLDDQSCPQVVLRFGWPPVASEPVPETGRRPVASVAGPCHHLPEAHPESHLQSHGGRR